MEANGEKRERTPPWLLILQEKQQEKQFIYSISEHRFHAKSIPELRDKRVLGSAYGWLVLLDPGTGDCCLWNSASLEKIELPRLQFSFVFDKSFLSKPPEDPDCHVLLMSSTSLHHAFCQIGGDEFVRESFTHDKIRLLAITSFREKIYGFTLPDYCFVTVGFVGKTLELTPIYKLKGDQEPWCIPDVSYTWATMMNNYLIESPCGELWLVHEMLLCTFVYDGLDFRVFRVDTNQKECMEMDQIGNRAIFLSDNGSAFCCYATGKIRPNSIYYSVPKSRNLYVYDLDERSTTPLLPCPVAARSELAGCFVESQVFQK